MMTMPRLGDVITTSEFANWAVEKRKSPEKNIENISVNGQK